MSDRDSKYPAGIPCFDHMQLTNALSLRLEQHGERIMEVTEKLGLLDTSSRGVELALARMNGSIPKIELAIGEISRRFHELDLQLTTIASVRTTLDKAGKDLESHAGRLNLVEQSSAVNSSRQKMIWGLVATLFTGLALVIVKIFV